MTSPRDSEQGAAMVEFAITASVVFTLIFGVMLMALALYSYEVINQYARDASRYAVVHGNGCVAATTGNSCSIGVGDNYYSPPKGKSEVPGTAPADTNLVAYLQTEPFPGVNISNIKVTTAYAQSPNEGACSATDCNGSGDQVTVTISYPYLYAIPFIPSKSFTMNAVSIMTISQ